ncbi:unnamed protein product [Heterosigma akashiwo]|mmetsp:Transcript_9544/g.14702  ORF Transcript_9544/g.14702 Transcript_9544/m.14702 type:complete len:202 (+) Transcript_9544:44-649(+)|eukprot:CAMPEP_0194587308 /NCGR_PEP_ID=MMETSP0292-20121207/19065_1 /TAXON_ID=39354 /ORGANISM="Heterosigma akashiwo, Strain CCMP2393" /LENGTH=201 /DNA_ID=CAMNT_0039443511 /DNA_START=197 /DNA_END=802 /DNA_ORIENTATION=+
MPLNPDILEFIGGISFQPGVPVVVGNERFLMMRTKIHFKVNIQGSGRYRAHGKMLMTTDRLVFVAENPPFQNGISFQGYDLPLVYMSNERFNQPIFGANNLTGTVNEPAGTGNLEVDFKISFNNGGCMTFLQNFFSTLGHIRSRNLAQATAIPSAAVVAEAEGGNNNPPGSSQVPYATMVQVDPADPSVVFVQAYPIEQYG